MLPLNDYTNSRTPFQEWADALQTARSTTIKQHEATADVCHRVDKKPFVATLLRRSEESATQALNNYKTYYVIGKSCSLEAARCQYR